MRSIPLLGSTLVVFDGWTLDRLQALDDPAPVPLRVDPRPGEMQVPEAPAWARVTVFDWEDGIEVCRDEDGLSVFVVAVWPTDLDGQVDTDRLRRGLVDVLPLRLDPTAAAALMSDAGSFPPGRHDYRLQLLDGVLRVRPCRDTFSRATDLHARAARVAKGVPSGKRRDNRQTRPTAF